MPLFASHDFAAGRPFALRRARVPQAFLAPDVARGMAPDRDGTALVDIEIAEGRFAGVAPSGRRPASPGADIFDLDGRHVWPTLLDLHAHLDKGHIVDRTPNLPGTFVGARDATTLDRTTYWRHEDLIRRMTFGLRCAEAHGVAAIRTHLDSHEGQGPQTWSAFREIRAAFGGRVTLQAVALAPLDIYRTDYAIRLADIVASSGGLLGGVTRASGGRHEDGLDDIDALLDRLFELARERDLDVDLHVDETGETEAAALPAVARATIRHGYEGRVACGHCCSLALQDEATRKTTIGLVADAGLTIVTLPLVNMYLQDRVAGRTPRWRGVTPVHELRAAGVRVAVAGDNCRDPFHAYGDHDMLDTFRQSVRILHLDHPFGDAALMAGPVPADVMGLGQHGRIRSGAPADLIVMRARSMDQVMARPQSDRIVFKDGRPIGSAPPPYDDLDATGTAETLA